MSNRLGRIRQAEILEQAAHDYDVRERSEPLLRGWLLMMGKRLVGAFRIGRREEVCAPNMTVENC
jgi:hypothetical protein